MPRVAHFEIHAENVDRAINFYREVFGWEIEKAKATEDYWLVTTGDHDEKGINGGLMRRANPAARMTSNINVPSVDEYVMRITNAGGSVVTPKTTIPGFGYLAYCQDTEGIIFGVFQPEVTAR